jgi:hypothetical protein
VQAVGEYDPGQLPDAVASFIYPMDGDGLSLWQNEQFTTSLVTSNAGVIFFGAAFVDEDVFIAALEASS